MPYEAYNLYNCVLVYLTPAGRRQHFRTKAAAQTADQALALAERHLLHDKRRAVGSIEHREAYHA
jgi:hypothetical protein